MPKDPLAPDPDRDITLDTATLRVLAHPMRLNLLNRLRQYGPATATQLADVFSLDTGAASYHLRRLAAGGLIEEDESRGSGRDRWWRAKHRSSFHDPAGSPDQPESRAYAQAGVLAYSDELRRVAGVIPLLPNDWYGASIFSDYTLRLTPDRLNALKTELVETISRYRDEDDGDPVSLQLQAFPLLDR
ncbi:ArsR/SmtB family transcription factor [Fodinicola acaciae]|uniref:ArsR/SmtB family transcription factor n=1 Tax=Fodinicola acaciae TaxID=2681555 RepID=UPI0013D50B9A|nr:helix-turn-helix domain-containing protein [Fodinicola acaciae]